MDGFVCILVALIRKVTRQATAARQAIKVTKERRKEIRVLTAMDVCLVVQAAISLSSSCYEN